MVEAGNDGNDACDYTPAHVSQAITVGESDRDDSRVVTGTHSWASNNCRAWTCSRPERA